MLKKEIVASKLKEEGVVETLKGAKDFEETFAKTIEILKELSDEDKVKFGGIVIEKRVIPAQSNKEVRNPRTGEITVKDIPEKIKYIIK